MVTKPEFDFAHAPIFRNVTIAAWDPGRYNGTLEDWLTSADYDLFTNYEIYRRRYPKSRAFLIDPHSVWRLWQSLQMFAGNRAIRRNPPSSGFIGQWSRKWEQEASHWLMQSHSQVWRCCCPIAPRWTLWSMCPQRGSTDAVTTTARRWGSTR